VQTICIDNNVSFKILGIIETTIVRQKSRTNDVHFSNITKVQPKV